MKKNWLDKRICDMEKCKQTTETYREYINSMCLRGNYVFDLDDMSEENLNFLLERIREAEDTEQEFILNLM